jgi:hypothetical protein
MEDGALNSSVEKTRTTEELTTQPGAQAVEALMRAIAQEFVLAFDDLHDRVLADDEFGETPKTQAAGS